MLGPPVPRNRVLFRNFEKFFRCAIAGSYPVYITVLPEDETLVGAAETDRMLKQILQHGFELEGRAPDDFEDFACRRLRLARLMQLTRT